MSITTKNNSGFLIAGIEKAIKLEIDREIKKETTRLVEEANKKLIEKIPEIVANISMRTARRFSLEQYRNEILVRIDIEDTRQNL